MGDGTRFTEAGSSFAPYRERHHLDDGWKLIALSIAEEEPEDPVAHLGFLTSPGLREQLLEAINFETKVQRGTGIKNS